MITNNSEFDFNKFFTKGGFQFRYSDTAFLSILEDYVFTKEKYNLGHNETIPVETAQWDKPFHKKEWAPKIYRMATEYLLNSKLLRTYQDVYGKFNFIKIMLHKTPKGYINTFHSHTYDGTEMHILLHFGKDRNMQDGGLIEIGEVMDKENVIFNPIDFYESNPKKHLVTCSSVVDTGLCTIINNQHPYFRHQVTEVLTDKPRYTLMIAVGYKNKIQKRKINHI